MRSHKSHDVIAEEEFTDIQGKVTRDMIDQYGWSDLFYSFGVAHPGRSRCTTTRARCRTSTRVNGDRVDLGTIDILRDRERGVPRYNDFREKLRKPRIERFEDLTENPQWAEEIRDVYDGRHRPRRPAGRACWPRRRRPASASATPRSGSSS